MKVIVSVILLSLVALTLSQTLCSNDADCAAHCHPHFGHCNVYGVCHCNQNARQTGCTVDYTCTCPDGSLGNCDHNGVCHCHH